VSPKPLHRWKSFWFGILVLAFLGWAWVVSIDHMIGCAIKVNSGWIFLGQMDGVVAIVKDVSWIDGTGRWIEINDRGSPHRETSAFLWSNMRPYGLFFPHRLLMLCFLLPWAGLLWVHWNRLRKLPVG